MSQSNKSLKIAIAQFNNATSGADNTLLTEKRLLDRLLMDKPENIEVCLADETVSTTREAEELGKRIDAAIVIWGQRDSSSFQIFVDGTQEELPYLSSLSIRLSDALETKFQTEELPDLLSLMAAFGVGQLYYFNNQTREAQTVALKALELTSLRKDYLSSPLSTDKRSQGYYLLGVMYYDLGDESSSCKDKLEDCQKAIGAYRKALELNPKLEDARLNLGALYEQMEEWEEALTAYGQLINSNSKTQSVTKACINRSRIFLDRNEPEAAIKDLEEVVCKQEPENPVYWHQLGLAQLQAEDFSKAEQTYQKVKRYVNSNENLKNEIVTELNALAKKEKNSALTEAINKITSNLSTQ